MSFQFSLNNIRFEDVRAQVIEFLKQNSQFSATFDWTGSNMRYVIDTMTYVTMLLSYQMTTVANNNFLDSTDVRKNAVSIAKTMGYRPKRAQSSIINTTIKYYDPETKFDANSRITIAAKSAFITNTGKIFINLEPVILTVSDSNSNLLLAPLMLTEGSFKNYTYLGTGLPYQTFIIPSMKVEENNLDLYVHKTSEVNILDNRWTEVKTAFNVLGDKIYFIEEDIANEGYPKIVFGDSVIGSIPTNEDIISIDYLETAGSAGNGDYLVGLPTESGAFTLSSDLTNSNDEFFKPTFTFKTSNFIEYSNPNVLSYGGRDLESLASIKQTAPKSFAAAGRAVTKNDFITLLSNYPDIAQGNAIGGEELYPDSSTELGNIFLVGIPYFDYANFLNTKPIYLTDSQEGQLKLEIKNYNIISTRLNFYKPSYIYVDIHPQIELRTDVSVYDETIIKNTIYANLAAYFDKYFTTFNAIYRDSKINSEIDKLPEVISSNLVSEYYFIINYDSFYEANNDANNFIYLPVKVKSQDNYGNITEYTNFVQTNKEYAEVNSLPGASAVPLEKRTIYGQLYHPNVTRFLYNEDVVLPGGGVEDCLVKIFGENVFFGLYRYNEAMINNKISDLKVFNNDVSSLNTALTVVQDTVSAGPYTYDNYTLSIGADTFGYVLRNKNRDFNLGPAGNSSDITSSPLTGQYYEVYASFTISGVPVVKGDTLIYDGANWQKKTKLHDVSAVTDAPLFTQRTQNQMYSIGVSGNFGGMTSFTASAGETIIFNLASSALNNWDKLKLAYPPAGVTLDASVNIPPAAIPTDIKLIAEAPVGSDFGGNSATVFYDYDLIMCSPTATAEDERWVKLINVASSAEKASATTISAVTPDIFLTFDYHPASGIPIGTIRRVIDIGTFPGTNANYDYVVWPSADLINQIAYIDDIIVYVGNSKWRVFSVSYMNLFSIDASVPTNLPITLNYADYFNISGTGSFNNTVSGSYTAGVDQIVYVGDGWMKRTSLGTLNASSAAGLPPEAYLGDILYITEGGYFGYSSLVAPSGQNFVQGDYMIFNGNNWIPLREYSFKYELIPPYSIAGQDFLNNLGFNSVFYYDYQPDQRYYSFKFNDIYHNALLGTFTYINGTKYEVGRLMFEKTVVGTYDLQTVLNEVVMKRIFHNYDDAHKMDKIRITPKNKYLGTTVLQEAETDFDTTFNQYIVVKTNEITKL